MIWRNQLQENERQKLVQRANECIWVDEGIDAKKYLLETRGISEEVIKTFNIGFIPLHVNHQLKGRIITPIYDVYGDLIAVSTRHIYKEKAKSFWHEDFEKSFHLYGLHLAKQYILKYNKVIVVEGEFDVHYLHSCGVKFAVGLCGGAFGLIHLSLLMRYCDEIYLMFDGDNGGKSSFKHAKEIHDYVNAVELGNRVISIIPTALPNRYDPDDFLKENKINGLVTLMKSAKSQYEQFGYV